MRGHRCLGILLLAAAPACGGSTSAANSASDSGVASNPTDDGPAEASEAGLDASTPNGADGADGPADGGVGCYLDATGSEMLDEYESAAVGTLRGTGLDGIFCQGGTGAYAQHIVPQGTQQQDYTLLFVRTTLAPDGTTPPQVMEFTTPDVHAGSISMQIGFDKLFGPPLPGTYTNVDCVCGDLQVNLTLPATGSNLYFALGSHDCSLQEAQTAAGSWTLQITSVTGWDDGGPGSYYVVHGSLVAQLIGNLQPSTASLSLVF